MVIVECDSGKRMFVRGARFFNRCSTRCADPARKPETSGLENFIKWRDGDDLVASDEHATTIATDSQTDGVVNVNLASRRAVTKVVEIGVDDFQKVVMDLREDPEADVRRAEIDDDHLADEAIQDGLRRIVAHDAREFALGGKGNRGEGRRGLRLDEF